MKTTSISTVAYSPGIVPEDDGEIRRYLGEELDRISAAISRLAEGHLGVSYEAPAKPREGNLRIADGTTWNPGSGEGVYVYLSGAWVFLGSSMTTPTSIVNYWSSGASAPILLGDGSQYAQQNLKRTVSGSMTAGTLATAITISGGGVLKFFAYVTRNTTSRTLRVKITIDGAVAFDNTSGATTTQWAGMVAVGSVDGNASTAYPNIDIEELPFTSSLLIEVAQSDTSTANTEWYYSYDLRA